MKSISITTHPRIHITLIGMDKKGYRRHGGIGFSISNPVLNVIGCESNEFQIIDNRNTNLDAQEYNRLLKVIELFYNKNKFAKKISLVIKGELLPHVGFGSETALRLSSLEILSLINNRQSDKNTLIYYSGRGGVSGIGINAYFDGGMIFDTGIKKGNKEFNPSNLFESRNYLPLMIKRVETDCWELGLYLNPLIKYITEKAEAKFFQESCPILDNETYEILYHTIYGCLSSIIEKDKNSFFESINQIQKTKWKSLERSLYKGIIREYEELLFSAGATAIGMSSLGPLLYFFSNDPIEEVMSKSKNAGLKGNFFKCFMFNHGREIHYE